MYSADSYEIMEESARHGLGHGFSVPVKDGLNVNSILCLARDKPFESSAEMKLVLDTSKVLAHGAYVASKKIIMPEMERGLQPKLTPRERECLKWIAQGKSNSVIADILNLSDATVEFHIRNLFTKLNVATRVQAAVIAVSMGLIG